MAWRKTGLMLMSAAFLASALIQFALGLVMAAMLGPAEFGLYALAFAASVIGQTLVFEWIRLSITRYQGSGASVSARLGMILLALMALMLALAAAVFLLAGEKRVLLALTLAASALWGLAECRGATLRARFAEKSYAGLLSLRAMALILLMPLAAWFRPQAEFVLGAQMLAVLAALVLHRLAFSEMRDATGAGAMPPLSGLFGYAMPIVATNLAYLLLLFGLRLFIATRLGLGDAGSFSLALDLGLKLVMTIGSALDLYLFQLAVRDDREKGAEAGRERLALNFAIVLAVLAPTLIGLWLVLPSLEALVITPDYRPTFARYMLLLLPGLFLVGVVQYAIHPVHQLASRTMPLVLASGAAAAAVFLLLAISRIVPLPASHLPGIALLIGMLFAVLVLWRAIAEPPPIGWKAFLPRLLLALTGMVGVALPIRLGLEPGAVALAAAAMAGGLAYLAIGWFTNLADVRNWRRIETKNGA
jgi:O-antigen/teichoic acid export membrane protein